MASERQIAANRKNAIKSTGPKTRAGKQRAAGNAYRHGLSIQTDHGEDPEALVSLVWRIAGNTTDQNLLHFARIAARARLELVRIRQVKYDMIGRMVQFGALEPAALRRVRADAARYYEWWVRQPLKELRKLLKPSDYLDEEPSDADRDAEALRQLLPKLRKLDRYEARAYATMDRALRQVRSQLQNEGTFRA
jgi:hypothetical protein